MGEGIVNDDSRYWAFISYSHKDAAFGRRLHRRLEAYALPRRLVGRATSQGLISRRLVPVFRDREELPAAHDLSAEVLAALEVSRCLIVVCSPAAAASPWVAREVELFRALHPGQVLAAISEGDPAGSIPETMRHIGPKGAPIEPLAADFRRGRDGWELGLLKLVAGVAGVGLDELVQRDSQRRTRRVTAVTAGALALVLVMAVLTVSAWSARSEAERQRSEAEGLVEFMLTDLRTELKGVGRLDAMTAVNERALRYYGDQDLDLLPVESLERRARILRAMGEDDEARGEFDRALVEFREASRTTAAQLRAAPDDPRRIFDQAQSEFWLGTVSLQRKDIAAATEKFQSYKKLAEQLIALSPRDPNYRKEAAYANGNLCTVALEKPTNPLLAVRYCKLALAQMETAARQLGSTTEVIDDLVNRHGWLADAYHAANNIPAAKAERLLTERLLDTAMATDPQNTDRKETWVITQRALAVLEIQSGQMAGAEARLDKALDVVDKLIQRDPSNKSWSKDRTRIEKAISVLHSIEAKGHSDGTR